MEPRRWRDAGSRRPLFRLAEVARHGQIHLRVQDVILIVRNHEAAQTDCPFSCQEGHEGLISR